MITSLDNIKPGTILKVDTQLATVISANNIDFGLDGCPCHQGHRFCEQITALWPTGLISTSPIEDFDSIVISASS